MNRTTEHLFQWSSKIKQQQQDKRESQTRQRIKEANTPRLSKGTIKMLYRPPTQPRKLMPNREVRNRLNEYLMQRLDTTLNNDFQKAEPCKPRIELKENILTGNEKWIVNKRLKVKKLRQDEDKKFIMKRMFSPRLSTRRLIH